MGQPEHMNFEEEEENVNLMDGVFDGSIKRWVFFGEVDMEVVVYILFFFSSRRRHTRYWRDWSSDVCSSDLFIPGGWTIESLELSRCVGACRVVDLTHVEGHVSRADLEAADVAGTARLLLKTRNSDHDLLGREGFDEDYAAISLEAAEYLVEIGAETVGVDYLSVEPFEDKEFNTHHTLLGADVVILEGLVLVGVEPGEYFLACLPLKLSGSDGSPARAILLREIGRAHV